MFLASVLSSINYVRIPTVVYMRGAFCLGPCSNLELDVFHWFNYCSELSFIEPAVGMLQAGSRFGGGLPVPTVSPRVRAKTSEG